MTLATFENHESEVRSYIRSFPTVFREARGAELTDEQGRTYLDFFAGAGALNYGHNEPSLKQALQEYLAGDGVIHSLDMATSAKRTFIERFREVLLEPRGLDHKLLFPGPTGTNAVEVALKLARKATGRKKVYSFQGGFHGMTLGSLAVTSNPAKREGAGLPLYHTRQAPFDGERRDGLESLDWLRTEFEACTERDALPAAVVVETVQGEGGVRPARADWLRGLARLCRDHGVLLVVDDIQVGCGRTGRFFSFEEAGITPDIICLSKSLSGLGLPLALVLLRPELDVFAPGEHNGTFRGFNPAFVCATAALAFWEHDGLTRQVEARGRRMRERLEELAEAHADTRATVRGRGMVQGLVFEWPELAGAVARECFERGLLIETAGHRDEVLKLLPPLTLSEAELERGLDVIETSLAVVTERLGAALPD